MKVILFKGLAAGYKSIAVGVVSDDHRFFLEVKSIVMIQSHNGVKCSNRVGYSDIIKSISPDYLEGDTKAKIIKDFPEVLI